MISLLDPLTPCLNLFPNVRALSISSQTGIVSVIHFSEKIRSIAELIVLKDDYRIIDAIHDQIDEDEAEQREVLEQAHAYLKGLYLLAPS
jgi:hypothetical protein